MSALQHAHIVAIAGGSGTRFWPLSRRKLPKQLLQLTGNSTLLEATFQRVAALVPPERWWMVVGQAFEHACRSAVPLLPPAQVLSEPIGRNTAPAVLLAALHLVRIDPEAMMVVLPADHHVADRDAFQRALRAALPAATQGAIVTLGIASTYPETGYGYIERGERDPRGEGLFRVARFREKPDRGQAEAFLAQGNFSWNAGIFVLRADTYLAECRRQLPHHFAALLPVQAAIGTSRYRDVLDAAYRVIESISIDYGVMEGARDITVVPVDCGWSDIGSFMSLRDLLPGDGANATRGRVLSIDSKDCVVYATGNHVVALLGVEDLVVVHSPEATLVLPAARCQDVRKVVDALGQREWNDCL